MLKITIPRVTPSLNKYLGMHYLKRHKLLGIWTQEIRVFLYEFDVKNPSFFKKYKLGKKKVKITSYKKRRYDQDNFIGGCKPLVDSLKLNGLIIDDSEKFVEIEYEQKKDKDNPRTEIIISSL